LVQVGAKWADSAAELVQQVDTIIFSLPGPAQVEELVFGAGEVAASLTAGQRVIDMSTNSRVLLRSMAASFSQMGVELLDAPVTGAVDGAAEGRLTIFVGGETTVFTTLQPVFAAMGEAIYCGPIGSGTAAKLVTNLLWFVNAVAIGEGLVLGQKAGISLDTLWDIIKKSVGNSWVAEHDVPSIFAGHYDPSFTLDLCTKDLHLINLLGKELQVPLEFGELAEQIFRRARAQYGGEAGELHVVKLLEDATGTSLQLPGYD
jgi:3-hydroxyisobutyrate dehydrogenase-like beta-hydroxyacid dehydrogenase